MNADTLSSAGQIAALDKEAVQRFLGGDEDAFTEIMERHREKVFVIALTLLRNRADAEEIAQDTFIRAHRALPRFRNDSSLSTWLHRIAVNLSRNRYWYFFRRRRQSTVSMDCLISADSTATFGEMIVSDAITPNREVEIQEFAALCAECMEKLEPRHREILTLRNLLHRSYEEIANALGINVGTVKSRIARARKSLEALIQRRCSSLAGRSTREWFDTAAKREIFTQNRPVSISTR